MILVSSAPHLCAEALDDERLRWAARNWQPTSPHERLVLYSMLRELLVVRGLGGDEEEPERYRLLTEQVREAHGTWRVPEVDARAGRRLLVQAWRDDVNAGILPTWRRRGPPSWLTDVLWEGQ